MPTYQYACTECGEPLEIVQKFSDVALTECPACQGRLRKVFSPAAIVFRGSGFYRTDSRKVSGGTTTAAKDAAGKSETKKEAKKESASESSGTSSKSADSSSTSSSSSKSSSEKVA